MVGQRRSEVAVVAKGDTMQFEEYVFAYLLILHYPFFLANVINLKVIFANPVSMLQINIFTLPEPVISMHITRNLILNCTE